eukprot:TRINITY_DN2538_c0_g1_i2.p2 TRINITY_DN2538_c0_g1~~TRINITY_DN2538_c0_g1_i2.p2  ORF type:complete len:161 (-),score=37.97 TRINITY_DN2538_c0_g1_i2:86-568(-)
MFFFLLDFEFCQYIIITDRYLLSHIFFFNDTATTEIYTILFVGSVRCVQETGINAEYMGKRKQLLQEQIEGDKKVQEILGNKNMVDGVPDFSLQGSYRDVGAEAKGDSPHAVKQEVAAVVPESATVAAAEDVKEKDEFRKGTIEYDGSYLKDLKGYKKYD